MADEATTNYVSIIDQMTVGHRRLTDTFGQCAIPKVAWQIDPFGHSKEQAALFAAMGFDALFFAREDYQEKSHRIATKTLEHMWQASEDLGTAGDLFTGLMKNHYGPLSGLYWDLANDGDDPIVDNIESEEYNVPSFVKKFTQNVKNFAVGYPTNNILVPMGNDFHYMNGRAYFKNMDKLIRATANSTEVKVFYSTPSCYAKALRDSGVTFTSKVDDFFPYASDYATYWTGYYTSRPSLKRFERVGNGVLQTTKQLHVLAGHGPKEHEKQINRLKEWMGVMQHHDAIAGTEKQHVTNDYAKNLDAAIRGVQSAVIGRSVSGLLATRPSDAHPPAPETVTFCPLLNVSSCPISESGSSLVMHLYNPLGQTVTNWTVRLPVKAATAYRVFDEQDRPVPSSLVPIPLGVQVLPDRETDAQVELVFTVSSIPPLGLISYFIKSGNGDTTGTAAKEITGTSAANAKLTGRNLTVHFDGQGELKSVQLRDGTTVAFSNEFHYYRGSADNVRNSGAYVFRPAQQSTTRAGKVVEAKLFSSSSDGRFLQEVHQKFDVDWISQVVRLVPGPIEAVEFEWTVGPIPVADGVGKEIVALYKTDLDTGNSWKTDSNGRQLLQRRVNFRPSWKLQVHEPVSGNYYPVNSRLVLEDTARRLAMSVLTDRTQGGTSLQNGSAELMVHRRLLHDDYFGVGEPLNEPGVDGKGLVIRGRHQVLISSLEKAASQHRRGSLQLQLEPFISFSQLAEEYEKKYSRKFQGLSVDLPSNVHLLTLEQWKNNELLLRLEHLYQKQEDSALSKPVTVNLRHMFAKMEITAAQELTLSGHSDVSKLKNRFQYKYTPIGNVSTPFNVPFDAVKLEVTLNPMQIRTFAITVIRK